jgi:hypothetical protein
MSSKASYATITVPLDTDDGKVITLSISESNVEFESERIAQRKVTITLNGEVHTGWMSESSAMTIKRFLDVKADL